MFLKCLRFNRRKQKNNFICSTLYTGYDYFTPNTRWFLSASRRFWDYGKLGFKSYDSNYIYLLILLRFKLKRMKETLENGRCIADKTSIQSIRICIRLLDLLITNKYNYWNNRHHSKWGKPIIDFHKEDYNAILYSIKDNRYDNITQHQIAKEQDEYIIAQDKDIVHKERDIHLLFNIMSKYYTWWWD